MSSEIVPVRTIYICDRCKAEGERGKSGAFEYGGIHAKEVEHWGRGHDGSAGGVTINFDLCVGCAQDFQKFMARKK